MLLRHCQDPVKLWPAAAEVAAARVRLSPDGDVQTATAGLAVPGRPAG